MKRSVGEIDKHVAARVRVARHQAEMSQAQLGEHLGVTFQQIQKYEKAVDRISCGALALIAGAVGHRVAWFFEGAPTEERAA